MSESNRKTGCLHQPPPHLKAPSSVWKLIEQRMPEPEIQEVKNILGASLVEENIQLYNELETLQDIFQEYQPQNPHKKSSSGRMAEPPAVRKALIKEINFLVTSIKEKLEYNNMDSDHILSKYNREILDYVSNQCEISQETNCVDSSPSSSCKNQSISSTIDRSSSFKKDDIETLVESLNYLQIDDIAKQLRSRLEEEIREILDNIKILQNSLDITEQPGTSNLKKEIPTLTELRLERKHLEEELLKESSPNKCVAPAVVVKLSAPASVVKLPIKKPNRNLDVDKNIQIRAGSQYKKPDTNIDMSFSETLSLELPQYRYLPHPPPSEARSKINSAEKFRRMIHNSRVAH